MRKRVTDGFVLTKQPEKNFKILQLTDTQIIDPSQQPYEGRLKAEEAEMWKDRDRCVFNLIRRLIERVSPDYIVLTGDNVYGQFDADGSNFIAFVNFMESFRIPWSFVNGNHDGEYYVTSDKGERINDCGKGMAWQADYVARHTEYCLFDAGDLEMGYGNYTVCLRENRKTIYTFTMMDTHGCIGYESAGINEKQAKWYENQIKKINKRNGKNIPNFIFYHIASDKFSDAMKSLGFDDIGVVTENGYPDERGNFGRNEERISSFRDDILWDKIKESGSTVAIFAGHDHINNASVMYDGVRLTFGTKTGTYDYHDQQGGTLITIGDDGFKVEPVYAEKE